MLLFSACGAAAASVVAGVAAVALGESRPEKMASQSCESPAPCAGGFVVVGADPPDAEFDDTKSKLLSLPKAVDSLLAWLAGGLLSKTGWKSSRPEREMFAKSSSAEPSLASSRPSNSSSRSSNAPFEGGFDGAAALAVGAAPVFAEPKISSTEVWPCPVLLFVIVAGEDGCSTLDLVSDRK
jgi:hypothetical protein